MTLCWSSVARSFRLDDVGRDEGEEALPTHTRRRSKAKKKPRKYETGRFVVFFRASRQLSRLEKRLSIDPLPQMHRTIMTTMMSAVTLDVAIIYLTDHAS